MTSLTEAISTRLEHDAEQFSREKQGALYIIATPIGHLSDITIRALGVLQSVDVILAEDTRVARVLLKTYGITTPTLAYHEHNAAALRPILLERLGKGEKMALISDAGTPLISDPGFKLVTALIEESSIHLYAIPGPSAVLTALMSGGLPTDRFFFAGFLPPTSAGRRDHLSSLKPVPGTLVLFESPKRLESLLKDALKILGDRTIAVCRELTKRFETIYRSRISEMITLLETKTTPLKGEIVVLISPSEAPDEVSSDALNHALYTALQTLSLKDAVASVAALTGLSKRTVYTRALSLRKDDTP
jgi:16S rRNA (cytidine1402-2'-O)-methyltransferase